MHNFDHIINRKGTYCTQWDYTEDRFQEKDILPFSISDMDIAAPDILIASLQERLKHPILGYSRWRNHDFCDAIQTWYLKRYCADIQKDWILYSPSVMYSISILIRQLSNEHDGVVIMTPAYNAFFDVIKNNNRKILKSSLQLHNNMYTIDFEDFDHKAKESRIILLCNPHNPVGRMWTDEEMRKIIEIAKKHNCWILSDEIHMDIQLDAIPHSIMQYTKEYPNIISINSISKSFNVPALSGSYCIIMDPDVRQRFEQQTRYTDFVNSPAILHVIATIQAYNHCEDWLDDLQKYLLENFAFVDQYLEEHLPYIKRTKNDSTYLCWLDCRALNLSDEELQKRLVHIGKVGIMSGSVYGKDGSGFLRFHVGCPKEKIRDGLQRIKLSFADITM